MLILLTSSHFPLGLGLSPLLGSARVGVLATVVDRQGHPREDVLNLLRDLCWMLDAFGIFGVVCLVIVFMLYIFWIGKDILGLV